jgi:hypothetical protein
MENFTVITPTGDRPQCFELCKKFIQRQSVLPSQWIVIDDGKTPMRLTNEKMPFLTYIRREPQKTDPKHTLASQMLEALKYVKYDKIFMMEDDDWYCSTYFEQMLGFFSKPNQPIIVGQGQTIYYHIPQRKYFVHGNLEHSSWCQTGFRAYCIDEIKRLCNMCISENYPYIDMRLWKWQVPKFLLLNSSPICIGIKGMPGRMGAVGSHRHTTNFTLDSNFQYLRQYVGNDIELYRKFSLCPKRR